MDKISKEPSRSRASCPISKPHLTSETQAEQPRNISGYNRAPQRNIALSEILQV